MTPDPPAELLPWDSEFFGRRIARAVGNSIDSSSMEELLEWASRENADCIYYLIEPCSFRHARIAAKAGFGLTGVRMTLRMFPPIPKASEAGCSKRSPIRPAGSEDLPALERIAGSVHRGTRFYNDPNFPDPLCSRLYSRWIARDVKGHADAVLVADTGSGAVGYVSCLTDASGNGGSIGLLGVSSEKRGRGLGGALLDAAMKWFRDREVERVTVVTQGCRPESQRLYQSRGFRTSGVGLWLHWWGG